jgi:hypothetical protein
MAAAIGESIMRLEEVNLTTFDGSELPREEDRIHNTHIQARMKGIDPSEHTVTYFSKPDGLDGPWKIWSDRIVLSPDTANYHFSGRSCGWECDGCPSWNAMYSI